MKKIGISLICILLMISIISCGSHKNKPEEMTNEHLTEEKTFTVIQDGSSEYVIVVNTKDGMAKAMSYYLQQSIFNKVGIMLPVRDIKGVDGEGARIVVGDIGDEKSVELHATVSDNSFFSSVDEGNIILFAKDITGYLLLEQYVDQHLLNTAGENEWYVKPSTYLYDDKEMQNNMIFNKNTTYPLVYDSQNNDQRILANSVALYVKEQFGIQLKPTPDSVKGENEIFLGSVSRSSSQSVDKYISGEGDYFVGTVDDSMILASNDKLGLVLALTELLAAITDEQSDSLEWNSSQNISGNVSLVPKDGRLEFAVSVAKKIYGTYSSWYEKFMNNLSAENANDHKLVTALIERMGKSLALYEGSSSALYDGNIVKLDTEDYSKVTYVENSHVYMAAQFAEKYFGKTLEKSNGFVDVTAICEETSEYTLYYNPSYKLAIVIPTGVAPYSTLAEKVGDYTNREYIFRMIQFFDNPILPEPTNTIEQTRNEIIGAPFESKYIYDYTQVAYDNFYSPAICVAEEGRVIYIAHERAQVLNQKEISTITYLKKSTDGGKTWTEINSVVSMRWASLIELNGMIYLLGSNIQSGGVHIARYNPADGSFKSSDLGIKVAGCAPNTVSVHNGRLFRAHNHGVISIDITKDLFVTMNWTVSNNPNAFFTREHYEATTGLQTNHKKSFMVEEGNIIVDKDGNIYAIYRIDASDTWGYAAIFKVSEDGTTVSPIESCNSMIQFPSTQSKFVIRYDEKTDKYITFVSYPTANYPHQRNVLAMIASDDLFHWELVDILLVDRAMMNYMVSVYSHGFQYIDFDFYGDDILFIVRESTGTTCSYHDGTFVTLYTVDNYVKFINDRLK